jgi:hypothetical protein
MPKQEKTQMSRLPVTSVDISWGLPWTSSDVTGSLSSIDMGGFSSFSMADLCILIAALIFFLAGVTAIDIYGPKHEFIFLLEAEDPRTTKTETKISQ